MSRVLRATAGIFLIATAIVHLNLYEGEHYRYIPTVGWLFLLTAISAVLIAIGLMIRPGLLMAASGILFSLGVLGGYLLTLYLPGGLFHFKEPGVSYSGFVAIVAETGTAVVLSIAILRERHSPTAKARSTVTSKDDS